MASLICLVGAKFVLSLYRAWEFGVYGVEKTDADGPKQCIRSF